MATKNSCLSFSSGVDAVSNCKRTQYNNLNLNQGKQCFEVDFVQSKIISNKNERVFDDCKNYKSFEKDCNNWSKFEKQQQQQFYSKTTDIFDSKESKKDKKPDNSSTLSLHIAAYENAFETDGDSHIANEKNLNKKNVKQIFDQKSSTILSPFEIPRQQDDTPKTPEVMQFKASQKMAGNDHGSAGAKEKSWFGLPFVHTAKMGRRGGGGVRSASPKASGPVRSAPRTASPAPPSSQRSFAAPPPRPGAGAPPPGGNAPPMGPGMHPPPSQGPGLMGQMAATAGGVAIGSAVGHAVGNMFTGGHNSSGSSESAPLQEASPVQTTAYGQQQQPMQLCEVEWRQLVECTQRQNDLTVCQAFQDLFKDCKTRNGI